MPFLISHFCIKTLIYKNHLQSGDQKANVRNAKGNFKNEVQIITILPFNVIIISDITVYLFRFFMITFHYDSIKT